MNSSRKILTTFALAGVAIFALALGGCNVPEDYDVELEMSQSYIKEGIVLGGRCQAGPSCEAPNVVCGNGDSYVEHGKCYICPEGQTPELYDGGAFCDGGGIIIEGTVQMSVSADIDRNRDSTSNQSQGRTERVTGGR